MFTFHLRPRVMQEGSTCKLLCCLTGNPHPAITWTKVTNIADYFPIHHIFFSIFMVCTKLQSRMVFIPRWISHLCYNSHHFGPLVADTVFGNHYFEVEHCHCRCFCTGDYRYNYLNTYLRISLVR